MRLSAMRCRDLLSELRKEGWDFVRHSPNGNHLIIGNGGARYAIPFEDNDQINPKMVARIMSKCRQRVEACH